MNQASYFLAALTLLIFGCAGETSPDENNKSAVAAEETENNAIKKTDASLLFFESGDLSSWKNDHMAADHLAPVTLLDTDKEGTYMAYSTNTETPMADALELELEEFHPGPFEQSFRVSIHIKVKDYKTWKWLFDGEKKTRENAGMNMVFLGNLKSDPNDVYMLIALPDIAKAREMMNKPVVMERMIQSGVIGAPEIRFWRIPD